MRFHRPRALATRPKVSVVIPCYNYGHYLPTAVASALDQAGLDVDVLIVDDASPDGSAEVALDLARRDQRVDVLLHETNRGHIATYNDGLAKVTGDYVVLLSADDALPRNALSRAVALMEDNPRVGLVYGFPRNFVDVVPDVPDRTRSWSVWSGREWLVRACRTGSNVIMSPEVVMRRAAWDQAGPYDSSLPHAADLALWLATATAWDIGRVNGPAQALYRVHGANMHLTRFAGMLVDLPQRLACFEKVLGSDRVGLDTPSSPSGSGGSTIDTAGAHGLLDHARKALAREALRIATDPDLTDEERAGFVDFARVTSPDATEPRRLPRPLDRVARSVRWHRWRRYGW